MQQTAGAMGGGELTVNHIFNIFDLLSGADENLKILMCI